MIKIQKENFDIEKEIILIKSRHNNIGAVSTFVGFVRDNNNDKLVKSIDLEVYEKMAYKTLRDICDETKKKWELIETLVIHRFGHLKVNEKIVLVATFAKHRSESEASCSHIMEYLKKDAPFWKKEFYKKDFNWL
tara:strand:- start:486 stop:890 length:405 start_codon:yes stop_codon:yes gene_type:complete